MAFFSWSSKWGFACQILFVSTLSPGDALFSFSIYYTGVLLPYSRVGAVPQKVHMSSTHQPGLGLPDRGKPKDASEPPCLLFQDAAWSAVRNTVAAPPLLQNSKVLSTLELPPGQRPRVCVSQQQSRLQRWTGDRNYALQKRALLCKGPRGLSVPASAVLCRKSSALS